MMDTFNPKIKEQKDELRYRNMSDEEFCRTLLIEAATTLELEAHKRLESLLGEINGNS
jgi:hypothetical protein